ncbi:hypothetical protein BDV95DRAFT_607964 [Massariosphaeria phaeospora]|uniref:Uncharacterized protein n=1 Tax=Massariosphaeria phaeospora TaxID=100035 RepID=A0A7C8IE31_9PLEO|nr:hypothetical protein BDV95DRAFT_607964 [Massariosphaeria phaeospora]
MSYADMAAKGPKQSPEEVGYSDRILDATVLTVFRAPAPPQIEKTDDSVSSLVDVDSPHISSVPSDYDQQSIKTDTQAERIELEEETKKAIEEAKREKEHAKQKTKEKAEKAKSKAKDEGRYVKKNSDNPVFIGNALTIGIFASVVGVGAYRKYVRDELTWKVAGAWAGVVGLFAVGDYYVSQYFFQKYPPKN